LSKLQVPEWQELAVDRRKWRRKSTNILEVGSPGLRMGLILFLAGGAAKGLGHCGSGGAHVGCARARS
jgi:hypothetical protein